MQVFISHSSADRDLARELSARLSGAGFQPWSEGELLPGDNWQLETGQALEQSEAMIVLVSPEWSKSPWDRNQVQYALGSLNYENRVIPVEVRRTEDIPWMLKKFSIIPGSGGIGEISNRVLERLKAAQGVAN
jgi:hypothetical protein